MRILLPLAALAMTLQPAVAFSAIEEVRPPSQETRCDLGGWPAWTNRRPIAVYAEPRANARIVGTLPTAFPPGIEYPVSFSIVGARDGWLKIADASDAYNEHPRPTYTGVGWIKGAAATLGIQSGRGYAEPDIRSKRLLDLDGGWLTDRGRILGIAGCADKWVLVDYRLRAPRGTKERVSTKRSRAWFQGACSMFETSCDMPSVDIDPAPETRPGGTGA
jgi:hypothetical protein